MLKIKEVEPSIQVLVERNGGYCPCAHLKIPDTLCMCRAFREQTAPGLCLGGRYEKTYEEVLVNG